MNNKKVSVVAALFIKEMETGTIHVLSESAPNLDMEQFGRVKASFESGRFGYMNEDEELADLMGMFGYSVEDDDEWEKVLVEYPLEIKSGFSFEALPAVYEKEVEEKRVDFDCDDIDFDDDDFDFSDEAMEEFEAFERTLYELNDWMTDNGFYRGEMFDNGFDIYWEFGVFGLQRGFTRPVGLMVREPDEESIKAGEDKGYLCFTDIEEFKEYIKKTYLGGN